MKKPVAIFGYNEYAKEIALNFRLAQADISIYVLDEKSFKDAQEDGFKVELVELDDEWLNIEKDFNIDELVCFCALDDDAQNVFLTISLRAEYSSLYLISLATSKDSADKLRLAGANKAIAKLEASAHAIVECLEKPAVVEVMNEILSHNRELRLAEFTVSEKSVLVSQKLHDIVIHKEFNIIILAISDQRMEADFSFTSTGYNHIIDNGDVLVVIGKEADLENFEKAII